ncbi:MAG: type II secretion system protein [Synergistaceae bacterium]|nr:type II secretion system protein [Synergistaceae bacterium]MBQ6973074.1 type II secretion system protein [Synergistaceae bacterium]
MKKSRKGFTLVELLIVIVVIGILSAMMMLSSTEAVTSAKASNIVSNLRNLKTAALAYYTDHMDDMEGVTTAPSTFSKDVAGYLSNKNNISEPGYDVVINSSGEWYVTYTINNTRNSATEQAGIINKLKGRAKSVGLCGGVATSSVASKDNYGTQTAVVAMFVR